ncbi:hypothetical protein HYW74_03255 [Candidatus Pacearchaeota archaeon]|nr:hypothetical protein [Candidatus Pacearchaeota archaeon]
MLDRLLLSCDVKKEDLVRFHNYGISMVNFSFGLLTAVDTIFSGQKIEEFKPPFDFPEEVYW